MLSVNNGSERFFKKKTLRFNICAAAILVFQTENLMRVPVWLCVYPLNVQRAILWALR
jgi:hypothetical protein